MAQTHEFPPVESTTIAAQRNKLPAAATSPAASPWQQALGPAALTQALQGQRVLLVAPQFFGYEKDIRQEIERQGAVVDWLPDRPFDTPAMTALTKLRPGWILPAADRLYRRLLDGFGASRYDTILVLNGQTLSARLRSELRTRFPTARMVLYMWDSQRNRPGMADDLQRFDAAFTFDADDARRFGMRLRPLFFGPRFELPPSETFEHHLCFIGTAHTDRYAVVNRLRRSLPPGLRSFWYLYLQAPWVLQAYRLSKPAMRHARRDEFHFTPMAKSRLGEVFAASRAILDIEHPQQRGLTMRTLETLGAHKKLVSTNAQVRDYDFYDPRNICVIDRNAPRLPEDFLASPLVPWPQALYHRYSLRGWVQEVLGSAGARP